MTEPMTDAGILFSWYGVPCFCRCDHCLLSSGAQPTRVPYDQTKAVVARYLEWQEQTHRKALSVSFTIGYSLDFPHLLDYVAFCTQNRMQGNDFLQVGGIRKRRGTELRSFLEVLVQTGIRRLGVSLHGVEQSHDCATHRKGDFEFLLEMIRRAAELGLGRIETIFLRKSTLGKIPQVLASLDALGSPEARYLTPFDYRGRGKSLEFDRPTAADLTKLPVSALGCLNARTYRSETKWLSVIASGRLPQQTRRYYLIPINEDTIGQLQTENPDTSLSVLLKIHEAFRKQIPPLPELSAKYGDPTSERLYTLRDLEWKWTDAYLAEHPSMSRAGVFDDLQPCVLCK